MARFIHAIDQYEKHQTNKAQRRGNGKEIEFGLEIYLDEQIEDRYGFGNRMCDCQLCSPWLYPEESYYQGEFFNWNTLSMDYE